MLTSVQLSWTFLGVTGHGRRALVRWVKHPSTGWSWLGCLPVTNDALHATSPSRGECPPCSVNTLSHSK